MSTRETLIELRLLTVNIDKGDGVNAILGQSHFVKTVGDIHEAPVQNICENKFGVAFYEASDVMASLARDRRGDEQASPSNALALFFGQGSQRD